MNVGDSFSFSICIVQTILTLILNAKNILITAFLHWIIDVATPYPTHSRSEPS